MPPLLMLAAASAVLQLAIDPAAVPPDVSLRTVTHEIRAIWQPQVEIVVTTSPGASCVTCDARLDLHISEAPPIAGPDRESALGWIDFVGGRPDSTLTISVARARRVLADAVFMGRPLRLTPTDVQTKFLSTTIARAAAHEIGHYILRSAAHQPTGLMKSHFTVRDLMDTNAAHFRLTPADQARLMARAVSTE